MSTIYERLLRCEPVVVPLTMPQSERIHLTMLCAVDAAQTSPVQGIAHVMLRAPNPVLSAVKWAQSMARLADPAGVDVLMHPLCVIAMHGGDCLTIAGALAAVLVALRYSVAMCPLERPTRRDDHVVLAVKTANGWRLVDPTGETAEFLDASIPVPKCITAG